MTLPELLITVTIMGLIIGVITMSIIVTLKQSTGTQGRITLAASEQRVGYDLPVDLASAATVDTDPKLTPCGTACPPSLVLNGSNAALLTWSETRPSADGLSAVNVVTNVSYYFAPTATPNRFELRRIECVSVANGAWTCESATVLSDLDGPPGGGNFVPGDTKPYWIIQVSEPLAPDAVTSDDYADASTRKDANRVVVTINGGGTDGSSGGGSSQIAITAGGTSRRQIPADSTFNAPTFNQAISKCGGPVTLILDNSGSIGTSVSQVRTGAKEFVKAFAGTPTSVQVVLFSSVATVFGAGSSWNKYFDLSDPAQVTTLLGLLDQNWGTQGNTNWEDAMFRTFFEPNGNLQQVLPETVVFFTDGEPTKERLHERASPGQIIPNAPALPEPGWTKWRYDSTYTNPTKNYDHYRPDQVNGDLWSTGFEYSQIAFNRADYVVDQVRGSVKMVGVGVGGITTVAVDWVDNPGARYDIRYDQGYRQYKQVTTNYQRRQTINYQKRTSTTASWQNTSQAIYAANYLTKPTLYQIQIPTTNNPWITTTKATFDAGNYQTTSENDGYRTTTSEAYITKVTYDANNTTPDATDGYYDAGKQKVTTSDADVLDWELDLSLTADGNGIQPHRIDSPTGAYSDAPSGASVSGENTLSRLISGGDNAVRATYDSNGYATNANVAELYVLPTFDKLANSLYSIAMSECGGTVTVATKLNGGNNHPPDPFTYQNSQVQSLPVGSTPAQKLDIEPLIVTTSTVNKSRTFDFDMTDGKGRIVDIVPHDLSSLTGYTPAATPWTCTKGITALSASEMQLIPIANSPWQGVRITLGPNTAVSCNLNVVR